MAGNSLGALLALYAAASCSLTPCISLNGAGRFRDPTVDVVLDKEKDQHPLVQNILQTLQTAVERLVIAASFLYTKQPAWIQQVSRQVTSLPRKC